MTLHRTREASQSLEELFHFIDIDQGLLSLIKEMDKDVRSAFLRTFKDILEDELIFILSKMEYPYARKLMTQRDKNIHVH